MVKRKSSNSSLTAKIDFVGDDQGGGMSYCTSCHYNLTIHLKEIRIQCSLEKRLSEKIFCPSCNSSLSYGSTYSSSGGSDF